MRNLSVIRVAFPADLTGSLRITPCGLERIANPLAIECSHPGISMDVLDLVREILNFTPRFVSPQTGRYGALTPNASWDGVIGLLHRNEADICLPVITPTPQRFDVIDFAESIVLFIPMLFLVHSPTFTPLTAIWKPFLPLVWLMWFISLLSSAIFCSFSLSKSITAVSIEKYCYALLFEKKSKFAYKSAGSKIILSFWNVMGKVGIVLFAATFVRTCIPKMSAKFNLNSAYGRLYAIQTKGYTWVATSLDYSHIQRIVDPTAYRTGSQEKLR